MNVALLAKNCTEVQKGTKHNEFPGKQHKGDTMEKQAEVKKKKDCCTLWVTTFTQNPTLISVISKSKNVDWLQGRAWKSINRSTNNLKAKMQPERKRRKRC